MRKSFLSLATLLTTLALLVGCRPATMVDGTTKTTLSTTTTTTTVVTTTTTTVPAPPSHKIQGVPVIAQRPAYPTGCESVSAVMALRFAGEEITIDEFIDHHLEMNDKFYYKDGKRYGPDPWKVFAGNPRQKSSYGCMAPVIQNAMIHYLGDDSRVINTTGTSLQSLCEQYIAQDIPVLVWVSIAMLEIIPTDRWYTPDGELFTWPGNEHCMVLVGYDKTYFYLNDPYTGCELRFSRERVNNRYETLGSQSLVVLPKT